MGLDPELWRPPVPIAHRGSRELWPENTMEAFAAAIELGYQHIETDLRLSSDGVVVCHHDSTVDRTTSGEGAVRFHTRRGLAGLDAGHRHMREGTYPFRGRKVQVPALEEVLTAFPGLRLVLELKEDGLAGPLTRLLSRLGAEPRVIVGSFGQARLERFRAASEGRVATSAGPLEVLHWISRGTAPPTHEALQVPERYWGVPVVTPRLLDATARAGVQVQVWTVNRRADMERLLAMGVAGLMTDRPDVLQEVLMDAGSWAAP